MNNLNAPYVRDTNQISNSQHPPVKNLYSSGLDHLVSLALPPSPIFHPSHFISLSLSLSEPGYVSRPPCRSWQTTAGPWCEVTGSLLVAYGPVSFQENPSQMRPHRHRSIRALRTIQHEEKHTYCTLTRLKTHTFTHWRWKCVRLKKTRSYLISLVTFSLTRGAQST